MFVASIKNATVYNKYYCYCSDDDKDNRKIGVKKCKHINNLITPDGIISFEIKNKYIEYDFYHPSEIINQVCFNKAMKTED